MPNPASNNRLQFNPSGIDGTSENDQKSSAGAVLEHQALSTWSGLVASIARGDQNAMEILYASFGKGLRLLVGRQLGNQDLDDHVQDIFLITISAIQRGEIHSPDCIPGFIRTVARRKIATQISRNVWKRNKEVGVVPDVPLPSTRKNPEEQAVDSESLRIMQAVLAELHPRDREILSRFYLKEESMESICADMNLPHTQFSLLKTRAKARFGEYGRRKIAKRDFSANFQRICFSA